MESKYSEVDVTWSSVEMNHRDAKTEWYMEKNGIPRFKFKS